MEGSNIIPAVGDGKVGDVQYSSNGAVLYQGQGKLK